jgi:hypothetical protein
MKRFIISLFAIGLGLAITGAAQAKPPSGGNKSGNISKTTPVNHTNMHTSFKSFTKDNFKYSHYCWSSKFHCNFYWYLDCYYYWCAPRCCYLPITYIEAYPPTQVVATTPVISQVVNVQNQNTNGSPGSVQNEADAVPAPPAGYGAGAVKPIGGVK